MRNLIFLLSLLTLFIMCSKHTKKLPILGNPSYVNSDTIYPTIPDFHFISQDSSIISASTFNGKIYLADFIFLTCPSICPKMNMEMLKVYETFKSNPNILYISHTIDPQKDSIADLKEYSNNLGVDSKKWFFVTGNKDSIYTLAEESYFASAYADSIAPGGFVHSGGILLIDKNKHIRGVYDGTDSNETERLKSDIRILLTEQF